jgi:hypothetical protein
VHIKDSITHKNLVEVTLKSYKAFIDFIDYIYSMNLDIKENDLKLSKKLFENNWNTSNAKMKIQGLSQVSTSQGLSYLKSKHFWELI